MAEVLLSLDPRDGNDPLEASVTLPQVPRKGDEIEVWNNWLNGPEFLEVERVIWCAYAPERIVVSVIADTYDSERVKRIFVALAANEQP